MNSSDLDEIVFENRNKDYGAYFLRNHYNKHLIVSLIVAIIFSLAIVLIPFIRYVTKVYADGTPEGFKYAELSLEQLELPKERVSLEPATEMMRLKPIIVDSKASDDALLQSEDNVFAYSEEGKVGNYGVLESRPSFRGGDLKDFNLWVATMFVYPKKAIEEKITGVFIAYFIVEKDGSVSNVKIKENADLSIANELKRVIYSSPEWSPGILAGKPVRVQCSVTLTLKIK